MCQYWADAASIGPVQAQYWQLMACLQGRDYSVVSRFPKIGLISTENVKIILFRG